MHGASHRSKKNNSVNTPNTELALLRKSLQKSGNMMLSTFYGIYKSQMQTTGKRLKLKWNTNYPYSVD